MKPIVISIVLLTITLTSSSQTKSYFPNLTKISIDTSYKVFFAFDKQFTRLINIPCYLLNKKDPLFCKKNTFPTEWRIIAKYKIESLNDSLTIVYSEGLSADPEYTVITNTGKLAGRFPCLEFYINRYGTIYTSGHVNNMYNRRRKYQIRNDTILEINQPYNYVGMRGKILKEITLYKDQIGNEIVAKVPKNYEVEILLTDAKTEDYNIDYNFLVKTDFGLVGWLRLTNDDIYGTVLKELYYAGD